MLKLDLKKAYDKVSWSFLRMLLIQIGLKWEVVQWIMGCVTSENFVVLINGSPTSFFKGFRGLRQGCPLSPLSFLLVVESLSRLLKKAKAEGHFSGLKVSIGLVITHLLFVDDVLILGISSIEEWSELKKLINTFFLPQAWKLTVINLVFFITTWRKIKLKNCRISLGFL
jgi:hypothetical protein